MGRMASLGAERSTAADEGVTLVGAAVTTIDSTIKRSDNYSYKSAAVGTAGYFRYQFSTSNNTAAYYYRFYFYLNSAPSAQDRVMMLDRTQTDGVISIRVETTGALSLYNESPITPAQIGSSSSALNTGQWYRIELKEDNTTSTSTVVNAMIDGVSFASGTVDTSRHAGQAVIEFGSLNNVTATYYFDDIAVNDASGSFQNTYPGIGHITCLTPNAAGDNNGFLVQVGGTAGSSNNYTRVMDLPSDDATSYNGDTVLNNTDDFKMTATPSSIGASDTINVVQAGVRFRAVVAASEAGFKVRIKKVSGGTVSESGQLAPNTTSWHTNSVVVPPNTYPLILYQDPDASNWTKSTLDTAQVGYRISATNTNAADISAVWVMVDSTPVASPSTAMGSTLQMMGVG